MGNRLVCTQVLLSPGLAQLHNGIWVSGELMNEGFFYESSTKIVVSRDAVSYDIVPLSYQCVWTGFFVIGVRGSLLAG